MRVEADGQGRGIGAAFVMAPEGLVDEITAAGGALTAAVVRDRRAAFALDEVVYMHSGMSVEIALGQAALEMLLGDVALMAYEKEAMKQSLHHHTVYSN